MYGRRRVGKTYLIRESFNGRFTFQHTGYYGGKLSDELFEFTASLREYGLKDFLSITGARYAIHAVLVTPYGITESSYAGNIQNVITMDDLFF